MRELAVLTGELADSLKDDETGLIIKKEDRKGLKVAVIYQIGENIDPAKTEDTTEAPKTTATEEAIPADVKPEEPIAAS